MPKAIRVHEYGGLEQLRYEDIEVPAPAAHEAQIRHTAIGLNLADVYDRTGLYPAPLPAILGREAAGIVVAVGSKVRGLAPGDRVAYVSHTLGAYSELRNFPADRLVGIPDSISNEEAAAVMLKGLTTQVLLRRTYRVKRGETILIHAAVGGVGSLAVQWAKDLGAIVIGVVGTETKATLARELGCDHVIVGSQDLAAKVKKITAGKGVPVVYDSVGQDTFFASLDCLAPLGLMVTFGNATGPVAPVAPLELAKRGSLFLTRPVLGHYIATRKQLTVATQQLFEVLARGAVKIRIGQRYPLAHAAQAHSDLQARKTTGSTVLIP